MKIKSFWALLIVIVFLFGGYGVYLVTGLPTSSNITETEITSKEIVEVDDKSVLIFYSASCPHCKIVEEYLSTNKSNLKISVKSLKIDDAKTDASNISLAMSKIQECKLGDDWGVPLMYYNGQCLMGDQPIIDFLNQQK